MAEKTKKPLSKEQAEKWAHKSWKPFLVMVIIGAVCATVAIVCFTLMDSIALSYPEGRTIPEQDALQILIYLGLGIGFAIPAAGLLGPGIPLMIVTIVKRNKAIAQLGKKKK